MSSLKELMPFYVQLNLLNAALLIPCKDRVDMDKFSPVALILDEYPKSSD